MGKDPELLSDDELLANLAAMIVLDASDGSLDVKEEAIDAELMELDRQVIDSELGPTVTGVKTDSEVGSAVTGVKHTAVARKACVLANDVVSKLPTPGRKRTKLDFDKNSAWNYYEEYRHSRRGKPDHAVGPRWHIIRRSLGRSRSRQRASRYLGGQVANQSSHAIHLQRTCLSQV